MQLKFEQQMKFDTGPSKHYKYSTACETHVSALKILFYISIVKFMMYKNTVVSQTKHYSKHPEGDFLMGVGQCANRHLPCL